MNYNDLVEDIKEIRQLLRSQAQNRLTCQLLFEVITDLTSHLSRRDRQVRARLGHLQSIITSHMAGEEETPDDAAQEQDAAAENLVATPDHVTAREKDVEPVGVVSGRRPPENIDSSVTASPVPVLFMHLSSGETFTIPDPVRILHHASGEVMGWSAAPQIVTDVIRKQLSRGHRSGAVSTESSDYSWNLSLSPAPKTGS